MSITWTLNDVIVVPWITVSPVQFIPGWTWDSGMIGPPPWASAALAGSNSPASTNRIEQSYADGEPPFRLLRGPARREQHTPQAAG